MNNFRTANCLEDLNLEDELHSFDSVMLAIPRHNIMIPEHQDFDFYIDAYDDSEVEEIKLTLKNAGGYTAIIAIDDDESYQEIKITY